METKKIDYNDPQVIDDATTMLKSQFTDLYVELGYNKLVASVAWHNVRTSSKGQEALSKLPKQNATSFIDPKLEAEERKNEISIKPINTMEKSKKSAKSSDTAEAKATKSAKPKAEKVEKPKKEKHQLVGANVQFSKRGSEEVLSGKVIAVFVGTDEKLYAKIRTADAVCTKQVDTLKTV